jgi:hypothetical protein
MPVKKILHMPAVRDAVETQNANREPWDHSITNLQTSHTEIKKDESPAKFNR